MKSRPRVALAAVLPTAVPTVMLAVMLAAMLAAMPRAVQAQAGSRSLGLAEAASLALERHPLGVRAREDLAAAEAGARGARGPLLPGLLLGASTTRFQEPMVVAPLHAFDPSRPPAFDETLIQSSLQASYTVFDGGGARARAHRADAGADEARAGAAATDADLLAMVVRAYVEVVAARANVVAAERQLAALDAERIRAERVFSEGAAPRVQVLRAGAAYQEARASESAARVRLTVAEQDVARLTGMDVVDIRGRELTPISVPANVRMVLLSDGSVDSAPELQRARRRVDAARAGERGAGAALLPRIDAVTGLQQFGSGDGGFTTEWQAGVHVSYPLFTGGGRLADRDRARARTRSAQAAAQAIELELAGALDRAVAAHAEASARQAALAAAIEQYEEVARIEALSLAEGAGLQRDLLTAEAELFRARSNLARVEAAIATSAVEIARLRGDLSLAWITDNLESRP